MPPFRQLPLCGESEPSNRVVSFRYHAVARARSFDWISDWIVGMGWKWCKFGRTIWAISFKERKVRFWRYRYLYRWIQSGPRGWRGGGKGRNAPIWNHGLANRAQTISFPPWKLFVRKRSEREKRKPLGSIGSDRSYTLEISSGVVHTRVKLETAIKDKKMVTVERTLQWIVKD